MECEEPRSGRVSVQRAHMCWLFGETGFLRNWGDSLRLKGSSNSSSLSCNSKLTPIATLPTQFKPDRDLTFACRLKENEDEVELRISAKTGQIFAVAPSTDLGVSVGISEQSMGRSGSLVLDGVKWCTSSNRNSLNLTSKSRASISAVATKSQTTTTTSACTQIFGLHRPRAPLNRGGIFFSNHCLTVVFGSRRTYFFCTQRLFQAFGFQENGRILVVV